MLPKALHRLGMHLDPCWGRSSRCRNMPPMASHWLGVHLDCLVLKKVDKNEKK